MRNQTVILYIILLFRCPNQADDSVKISNATSTNLLFHWEAESFRFFGASDAVYFACDVVVCESSNTAQVCKRCQSFSRKRRDVESSENGQVQSAMTVASPLYVLIDGKNFFKYFSCKIKNNLL